MKKIQWLSINEIILMNNKIRRFQGELGIRSKNFMDSEKNLYVTNAEDVMSALVKMEIKVNSLLNRGNIVEALTVTWIGIQVIKPFLKANHQTRNAIISSLTRKFDVQLDSFDKIENYKFSGNLNLDIKKITQLFERSICLEESA
jgi:hypothetical protein